MLCTDIVLVDRLPGTLSDTPWGLSGDTPGGRLWRFSGEPFATADEHIVCRLFVSHLASFLPRLFPTLFVCYCEAGGVKSRPSNFRPRQFTRGEAEERQNRQSPGTAYSGGAKLGGEGGRQSRDRQISGRGSLPSSHYHLGSLSVGYLA